jgi:hypothetical protein
VNSIEYIVGLKRKFSYRVYIILGNRDINKLRLGREVKENVSKIHDFSCIFKIITNNINISPVYYLALKWPILLLKF